MSPEYQIFRRIDVLDHVFGLAPHGSVIEYKVNGSTVEAICPPESAQHKDFVYKLEKAIETFCRNNAEVAVRYFDSVTAREIIDALFRAWCVHPNKVALEALGHVIVTDGKTAFLAAPFTILERVGCIENVDTGAMAGKA